MLTGLLMMVRFLIAGGAQYYLIFGVLQIIMVSVSAFKLTIKEIGYLLFVVPLILTCAKKGLPPSPDRFAPHLLEIKPINRIRVDLTFDEDINIAKLNSENLKIVSMNQETLRIRSISQRQNTVSLYTEKTKPGVYYIIGLFEDRLGNVARINKKFTASSAIDTIPPRIINIRPNLGATNVSKHILIEFVFSEPMDTSSAVKFLTTPLDSGLIKWGWSRDWQTLSFGYRETLTMNATVYFALLPTLRDLENNQIKNYGYTFFTLDSSLAPILVAGDLVFNQQPYKDGMVIFVNQNSKAFALSNHDGKFSIRLDSLIYRVFAVADTNFDNEIDLYRELPNFNPMQSQQLKFDLLPFTAKCNINQYLY